MAAGEVLQVEIGWPAEQLSPNSRASLRWTQERDDRLRLLHGTMTIRKLAEAMSTTSGAIRGRVTRLGLCKKDSDWTEQELALLRAAYATDFGDEIGLDDLAIRLGRMKSNVCRKARTLGLTNQQRRMRRERKLRFKIGPLGSQELKEHASAVRREWHVHNPHPRGMLGKKHRAEVKQALSDSAKSWWLGLTEDERLAHTNKAVQTKRRKESGGAPKLARGTWKAGWREIGGNRNFYRSRWEANYARWLQFLKERGDISDWQHEPHVFWFENIRRGVRSYKPDFRVIGGITPDDITWHEVKGWMDARSVTCLKRFAKYYPDEILILIREPQIRTLGKNHAAFIEGWEA